jgi:hypothetical protein
MPRIPKSALELSEEQIYTRASGSQASPSAKRLSIIDHGWLVEGSTPREMTPARITQRRWG